MKVIAHRGYSGKFPENTMLAFKKAYKAGADGIELDVQMTKDRKLVIIHDEFIDRVTDGTGLVRDFTFEELQKFNVNKKFGDKHGFNPIPSFEEYLSWVKNKMITTNIELKTAKYYYEDLEEKVVDMIRTYELENKVMFSSFNHVSLIRCKELIPEIPCGVLTLKGGLGNAGYFANKYQLEYYHPDFRGLTDELVQNCKEYGIKLNVWTVNNEEGLQKLYDWDCDGVITNYPRLCKNWLEVRVKEADLN
ncbi:MAG: glycerophosphodiester phosphodiesterase [Clostridiales bacterium]|nr:glycerophosphodiester phosphodiesterase [Clostridiales bacterium]